jgi:hypothetical protein
MSDDLANQIFQILIDELRQNGFEDVATFMISDYGVKDESYERVDGGYEYVDTESTLQDYVQKAKDGRIDVEALRRLLDGALSYFRISSAIPGKFTEMLGGLDPDQKRITPLIQFGDNNAVALSEVLSRPETTELIRILQLIEDSLNQPDNVVLNRLSTNL